LDANKTIEINEELMKIDLNKAYNTLLYKTVRRRLKSAGSKIITEKIRPKLTKRHRRERLDFVNILED